jgi:peptide deformylase
MAEEGQVGTDELDAQVEATRRLALAQIRQYPDPVLRLKAQEVEVFDDDLAQLVARMTRLMEDAQGVGLAANQVGVLRRVVVMVADGEEEPRVLVNPVILDRSDETEEETEGCLSLQGVVVPVERALSLRVEARDAEGAPVELELEGLAARVAQHEVDHLDGVLIVDRTTPEGRREALAVLRQAAAL